MKKDKDTNWKKYDSADDIPKRYSGNYAIYLNGNGMSFLLYIGTASDLKTRLKNHPVTKIAGKIYKMLECDVRFTYKIKHYKYFNHRVSTESYLIKRLSPPIN